MLHGPEPKAVSLEPVPRSPVGTRRKHVWIAQDRCRNQRDEQAHGKNLDKGDRKTEQRIAIHLHRLFHLGNASGLFCCRQTFSPDRIDQRITLGVNEREVGHSQHTLPADRVKDAGDHRH